MTAAATLIYASPVRAHSTGENPKKLTEPPSTPEKAAKVGKKVLATPDFHKLQSPMGYHAADYFEKSPSKVTDKEKKELKRAFRSMKGKKVHTIVPGSVLRKHPRIIRERKIQPDGNGIFVVDGFGYGVHPMPNGHGRLYPTKIKGAPAKVVQLAGSELLGHVDEYRKAKKAKRSLKFDDFLVEAVSPAPSLAAPSVPSLIQS